MTTSDQAPSPQQSADLSQPIDVTINPPSKKPKRWLRIILGAAIIFVVCACVGVVIFGKILQERGPVESVLDAFMKYMATKDHDRAYALLSPRAQKQYPLSSLQGLTEGNNYVLYEGYKSLSIASINISLKIEPDENQPQGTVAEVSGTVTYEDDIQGTYSAVLEKIADIWKIYGIFVTVPPEKFGP